MLFEKKKLRSFDISNIYISSCFEKARTSFKIKYPPGALYDAIYKRLFPINVIGYQRRNYWECVDFRSFVFKEDKNPMFIWNVLCVKNNP